MRGSAELDAGWAYAARYGGVEQLCICRGRRVTTYPDPNRKTGEPLPVCKSCGGHGRMFLMPDGMTWSAPELLEKQPQFAVVRR